MGHCCGAEERAHGGCMRVRRARTRRVVWEASRSGKREARDRGETGRAAGEGHSVREAHWAESE